MQVNYVLKEGFSGFKRAKLSMVAAIVAIAVSLLLLSCFSILLINANTVVNNLRNRVEMEAFIGDHLSQDEITNLKIQIELLEGVQQARLITKEEAAAIFKEEFGEDIYKVLNFNPLPASFKVFLKDGYKTAVSAEKIYAQLKSLKGVDDVIYRKQLLEMLDQRAMTFLWFTLGIGVFIAVSSIVLVANTIRLAIYSKRKIIQTMKLIGATRRFIQTPFVLEGLVQGALGGGFAAGVVFVVFNYLERWVSIQLSDFVRVAPAYYGVILGVGCVLGVLGSVFSVRKFIGESVVS